MSLPAPDDDSPRELSARWAKARRAALSAILAEPVSLSTSERTVVERACQVDLATTLRLTYENSLRLGVGHARFHRHQASLDEASRLLASLDSPCLAGGHWRPGTDAEPMRCLERVACAGAPSAHWCDYWREAIDGLVIGLTGTVRHTRHRSLGHGDADCLDVLYANPESPVRYGTLSDEHKALEPEVERRVRTLDPTAKVRFLGVSEGELLFELHTGGCGSGPVLMSLIESAVKRRFPRLSLREVSPRPVLGPEVS